MTYEIVADESVDYRIVIRLRENNFTVYSVAEEQPSIPDITVLSIAKNNKALLITEDRFWGVGFSFANASSRNIID
jgi:hypothetical protein